MLLCFFKKRTKIRGGWARGELMNRILQNGRIRIKKRKYKATYFHQQQLRPN